jgi:hypothetical protein
VEASWIHPEPVKPRKAEYPPVQRIDELNIGETPQIQLISALERLSYELTAKIIAINTAGLLHCKFSGE